MKRAVVLLSGGLDSTTVLAMAIEQGFAIRALSFRYGQRHNVELQQAREQALHYRVEHVLVDVDMGRISGSALIGDEMPVPKNRDIDDSIPVTYVPARNTIFLAHALAHCEAIGARDIFIGVNALDYSGYPDCRPAFIEAFERLANLATKTGVSGERITIHAPLVCMTKAEIIAAGTQLGVDYSRTSSCYDPVDGLACGGCDSCQIRRAGFKTAGCVDSTRYTDGAL